MVNVFIFFAFSIDVLFVPRTDCLFFLRTFQTQHPSSILCVLYVSPCVRIPYKIISCIRFCFWVNIFFTSIKQFVFESSKWPFCFSSYKRLKLIGFFSTYTFFSSLQRTTLSVKKKKKAKNFNSRRIMNRSIERSFQPEICTRQKQK